MKATQNPCAFLHGFPHGFPLGFPPGFTHTFPGFTHGFPHGFTRGSTPAFASGFFRWSFFTKANGSSDQNRQYGDKSVMQAGVKAENDTSFCGD